MTEGLKRYQRLFAELKRRNVFKSAAVYGGVAFVVIQAADFMLPALRMPEVVSTIIAVAALVGFPISMVLAWIYDVTDGGLRVTQPPSKVELDAIVAQPFLRRWPAGVAALLGLGLLILALWLELAVERIPPDSRSAFSAPEIPSLAVLPILNLKAGGEFLGEGVAAELLNALRRIPGLRVVAGTWAPLDGEPSMVSTLGGLDVAAYLEGSETLSAGGVSLALRLVECETESSLWTHTFYLPEEGFLEALDGVAWSVAQALGAAGRDMDPIQMVPLHTRSFPAYAEYLRGRLEARKGTRDAMEKAIEHFHRAVLLDSGFSLAWAALATGYVLLPQAGGPPMSELLPLVRAALDRAILPGAETAEGFAASAYLKWSYLWDIPDAETDLLRSIEMDPGNPVSRSWYSQILATDRRWDEALTEAELAIEMDPRSPSAYMTLGLALMCARRDGAAEAFERALELAPDIHPAAYVLGGLLAMNGDLEGASRAFDRFASVTGMDSSIFRSYLAALADPERRSGAVEALQDPLYFGAVQGAELLAQLGEIDASLQLLERAVEERSPYLPWINALPQYERLRSDPRFQSILTWVKFSSTSRPSVGRIPR